MCGETVKKTCILVVALLVFSVLTTSVSASPDGYYAVRFYGFANGICIVLEGALGSEAELALGRGRVRIDGLATALELGPGFYWVAPAEPPNISLRSHMSVRWGNKKLMVHIWPTNETNAVFNTTGNRYDIVLEFSGIYIGEAGLEYINGTAHVAFGPGGPEEILSANVVLVTGNGYWRNFVWLGEEVEGLDPEYVARPFIHRVTVWPLP